MEKPRKYEYLTQPIRKSDEDNYERYVAEMFQKETKCSDDYIKNLKWGQILGEAELTVVRKSGFKRKVKLSRELIIAITAIDNGVQLVFPSLGGTFVPCPHYFMYRQRFNPYKNEKAQLRAFKKYQEWHAYKMTMQKKKSKPKLYIGKDRIGYIGTRNSDTKLNFSNHINKRVLTYRTT